MGTVRLKLDAVGEDIDARALDELMADHGGAFRAGSSSSSASCSVRVCRENHGWTARREDRQNNNNAREPAPHGVTSISISPVVLSMATCPG